MDALQRGNCREYRMKGWKRAVFLILGLAALLAGTVVLIAASLAVSGADWAVSLMLAAVLLAVGSFWLAFALRTHLAIDGTHIEIRDTFKTRTVELSEIEGFRTHLSRYGSFKRLCVKGGRGTLTVNRSLDTDEAFRAWLEQLPDLNERDKQAILEEIAGKAHLGANPEERLHSLKEARRWNLCGLLVTAAAALGLSFGTFSLQMTSAAMLAIAPLAVLLVVNRLPLLFSVFKQRSDPRQDLALILLLAGVGLDFGCSGPQLLSLRPLSGVLVLVALAYAAAFYRFARKNSSLRSSVVGSLFCAALYSYGFAVAADTLPDSSRFTPYAAMVTGKHESHGRSNNYYLELTPWGPLQTTNRLSVSVLRYDKFKAGDTICLGLHAGALAAPWYAPIACPAMDGTQ
jgi:hypothetical protein